MARSKELYMEIAKIEMAKKAYDSLPLSIREQMDLKSIYVPDFPYKEDEDWVKLNKESGKLYRKLKDYEFKLRQK